MKRTRAAGIVIKDGKLLVIRRINNGTEYYAFPGGGKEEGESLEQAVVREIDEETTLKVNVGRLVYQVAWDNGDESFFYLCEYVSGEPALRNDSVESEKMKSGNQVFEPMWIDIEKLPSTLLYQLKVRDLFIHDYENGFPEGVQKINLTIPERRPV